MADQSKQTNAGESYDLMRDFVAVLCEKNGTALLKVMRNAGVDVDFMGPGGSTLLMFAVYYAGRCRDAMRPKMMEAIRLLLSNGANVNVIDAHGLTALSFALRSGQKDIIELLFNHGADFPSWIN